MTNVTFFRDSNGNFYIICDVAALGDCAVLAILGNPNFKAPLCTVQDLRRAVVSFAQGAAAEDCSKVYASHQYYLTESNSSPKGCASNFISNLLGTGPAT